MIRWRKLLLVAAAAITLAAMWTIAAEVMADALVLERPLTRADTIVVLSGAADYRQRARGAAAAYHKGAAPKILITDDGYRGGWDDSAKDNPYFVERMFNELVRQGVPGPAIERLSGQVNNTADEAEAVIRLAADREYGGLLVVTSDFHSRRALWIFEQVREKAGASVEIGLLRATSEPSYPTRHNWWMSVRGWRSVGGEYLKLIRYWLY